MNALEQKWNSLYNTSEVGNQLAAQILVENAFLLPGKGQALDLACGLGANAIFLAHRGLTVTALDISGTAIGKLRHYALSHGLPIEARQSDIGPASLKSTAFDVIVASRYLDRTLNNAIMDALKPGGLLFYQTYTRCKIDTTGPNNPDFLLTDGELLQLFSPLRTMFYRDNAAIGNITEGLRNEAQFVGRKPTN